MWETQRQSREPTPEQTTTNDLGQESRDGHFVQLSGNRLTRMSSSGEQYYHLLDASTRVTCDGVLCRASQLQAGQRIRVTNRPNDPHIAARIEVINTHDHFLAAKT
jgi:hypothetical protein